MFRSLSRVTSCFRFSLFSEMCNRFGKNLAYGTLLLRSVWQTIWRRGISRAGRKALLPRGLLRYVRSKMRWMQSCHYGELYIGLKQSMASRLFRLQGRLCIRQYSYVTNIFDLQRHFRINTNYRCNCLEIR